ncbi:hypothetical protein SKAU_G00042480 [Synaphobranchus kaupii]|uniref:Uncharacterized protein n=1 Tax=Synaphobranchus kaupii TaxID=118154 RepID=A0A9Q1J8M1_SYNKA|nr:hypothetical protein SKAU_G00042480 [Synaphobranchus kaupii]
MLYRETRRIGQKPGLNPRTANEVKTPQWEEKRSNSGEKKLLDGKKFRNLKNLVSSEGKRCDSQSEHC